MNIDAPILLVEDDENDILFMEMALKAAKIPNRLMVVRDGRAALRYLQGEGIYSDREQYPYVGLVLLDLGLPLMSGLEVLENVQGQPFAQDLVVVVLSSSTNPADIENAAALGAAEYRVKPTNGMHLVSIVRELIDRWLIAS